MSTLEKQIKLLKPLLAALKIKKNLNEKIALLNTEPSVMDFLKNTPQLGVFLKEASPFLEFVIKSVIVLGQAHLVFEEAFFRDENKLKASSLLTKLLSVEEFYQEFGGLIGYHLKVLELISEKNSPKANQKNKIKSYSKAPGLDLTQDAESVHKAILAGIKHLPEMAEVYPIGGAGDRLGLKTPDGKEDLPAACLPFLGRTLLEGLIRDLEAREYLYYKLFGKKIVTPIVLMTSIEKNNYEHILQICRANNWFGRTCDSFHFLMQPLVPVINDDGSWQLVSEINVAFKPGGHGVIWKLAREQGAFDWLKELGRSKALIRQINNPIAGTDHTLLAFTGFGYENNKSFGFLSCQRLVGSAEGVLVLVHEKQENLNHYHITNLEYTDFPKYQIVDRAENESSPYSYYPSNTNVLFFDIEKVQKAIEETSIPGILVNMKKGLSYDPKEKSYKQVSSGRLESTMQNIADYMIDEFSETLSEEEKLEALETYVVYNERRKTISVTKNSYVEGKNFHETPEGAFFDILENNRTLLEKYCNIKVPPLEGPEAYLKNGPQSVFLYHPSLGPLYSLIAVKLSGGVFGEHFELQLEIADIKSINLQLQGSLIIEAEVLSGERSGKCFLENVSVHNRGRKINSKIPAWRNQFERHESCVIKLIGNAEFEAKNVTLKGNLSIVVPDGIRMTAFEQNGHLKFKEELITNSTWQWHYQIVDNKLVCFDK